MKFTITLALILLFSGLTAGRLVNVNPDPDGDPWIAGGLRIPENFDRSKLNFIPEAALKNVELPSRVDNSEHKFFRPVFNQVGGSCSQAAGIGYTFTYEINRLRDLASDTNRTQYPSHFTYNFLNEGSGEIGSWWGDGWDIIQSVGIMNVEEYGGHFATGGNSRWISGIDEWKSGHSNRISSYNAIELNTPEGLNILKNWLDNHLEGSPYGGLAVFAAGATNYVQVNLPEGTHEAGKKVITKWGPDVNHAMTFIGYDDSIRFDYNNDGKFSNHDRDGNLLPMTEWEIGGLIVANSWGPSWGDEGKTYMMYKLLADTYQNGGIFWHFADILYAREEQIIPDFTADIRIKHERRDAIRIGAGYSTDLYSSQPEYFEFFPFLNYQGGDFYPQGKNNETSKYFDFSLDLDSVLTGVNKDRPFKFYFFIDERDASNRYDGEIISVVVNDNRSSRRYYDVTNSLPLYNNGRTAVSVVVDENTFVPENVLAFGGDGKVRLEWTGQEAKTTFFDSYRVYRNGQLYADDLNESVFTDGDVVNGQLYTYMISSVFTGTFEGEMFSYEVQSRPDEPAVLPYFTDFEDSDGGWTLKNDLSGWLLGDSSYSSEFCDYSGNSTSFILANPDLAGDRIVVRDHAVSPVFNIGSYRSVTLEFDYMLYNETAENYYCDISVMYRTGPDQPWVTLEQLGYTSGWVGRSIGIPYEAVSSNCTQFAFFMDDHYKWSMGGGGIDNIRITGDLVTYPPVIVSYYPEADSFEISDLEPVLFSVDIDDPDTGISSLDFKWYMDGELKQQGGTEFKKVFGYQGNYTVKVTVSDSYDEVSHEWAVYQTDIEENIPAATRLYQNYPNPFNPSTVIRFDNSKQTFTELNIFNSAGQLVKSLLKEELKPGSYSIVWDGKDNSGAMLSSGVYYYTVRSGNYVKTHKMLMFK